MKIKTKIKLFDEIIENMDIEDYITLNKGSINFQDGEYFIVTKDGRQYYCDTLEGALVGLGYEDV